MTDREGREGPMTNPIEQLQAADQVRLDLINRSNWMNESNCPQSLEVAAIFYLQAQIDELREKLKGLGGV